MWTSDADDSSMFFLSTQVKSYSSHKFLLSSAAVTGRVHAEIWRGALEVGSIKKLTAVDMDAQAACFK